MKVRMNYREANPAVYAMMVELEKGVRGLGLDKTLYELIKIRASQLNGCAFCIDMHAKELQDLYPRACEHPVECHFRQKSSRCRGSYFAGERSGRDRFLQG